MLSLALLLLTRPMPAPGQAWGIDFREEDGGGEETGRALGLSGEGHPATGPNPPTLSH